MGKVKVKKSDVWIDMTPMSDVMTLLLTFFMLTSTFVKNEPVKVNVPGSVSEIKVPENGVLTILVNPENPDEIAEKMLQLENDDDFYSRQEKIGLERAKIFSWRQTAEQLLAVYESVYNH